VSISGAVFYVCICVCVEGVLLDDWSVNSAHVSTDAMLVGAPAGAGLEAKLKQLQKSMGLDLCLPKHPCRKVRPIQSFRASEGGCVADGSSIIHWQLIVALQAGEVSKVAGSAAGRCPTQVRGRHVSQPLAVLPYESHDRLHRVLWAGQSTEKRRPEVLVLTGSALRALELMRQLPSFGRGCRIQKLFAKHMKVGGAQRTGWCH
jgi:hypothetical protein